MAVGSNIPQPFRDIGGNCIVVAATLPSSCGAGDNDNDGLDSDQILEDWMLDATDYGVCTNPPQVSPTGNPSSPFTLVQGGSQNSSQQNNGTIIQQPAIPDGQYL